MRRAWLGGAILLALLAFGFWSVSAVTRAAEETGAILSDAEELAEAGKFAQAAARTRCASELWQSRRSMLGVLLSHTELEDADVQLAALERYGACSDADDFLSACAALQKKLALLAESCRLSAENLF